MYIVFIAPRSEDLYSDAKRYGCVRGPLVYRDPGSARAFFALKSLLSSPSPSSFALPVLAHLPSKDSSTTRSTSICLLCCLTAAPRRHASVQSHTPTPDRHYACRRGQLLGLASARNHRLARHASRAAEAGRAKREGPDGDRDGSLRLHPLARRVQAHRWYQGCALVRVQSFSPYSLLFCFLDYVIVGSDSGRIVILDYDPRTSTFVKIHQETYGKSGARRIVPGQYLATDPKGRSVMIGSVEKAKLVYILNRDAAANLTISSPLEAHKNNAIIHHIVGLDVGFENPTFAALEVDYSESDQDPTGEAFNNAEKVRFSEMHSETDR